MSSLFAQYKFEREKKFVIETDAVLAVYSIDQKRSHMYLEDIYVVPEKRREGLAQQTALFLEDSARKQGLKYMVGSVVPSGENSSYSLHILLKNGYRLLSSHENLIFFIKDL